MAKKGALSRMVNDLQSDADEKNLNAANQDQMKNDAEKQQEESNPAKMVQNAAQTAKGVQKGMQAISQFMMMKKLMDLAAGILSAAKQVGAIAHSLFMNVVHGIGSFLGSVGSAVVGAWNGTCAFFGNLLGSAAAGTAAASVSVVTVISVGASAIVTPIMNDESYKALGVIDCQEAVEDAMEGLNVDVGDIDERIMDVARRFYTVLHTVGLSDGHIAGFFGNWSIESGMDPTTIEGIYDEAFNPEGPRHVSAQSNWDAYVAGPLTAAYAGGQYAGVTSNSGYFGNNGKRWPGLGLTQWTGLGAQDLTETADAVGMLWSELDFQIAYTLSKRYRPQFMDEYMALDYKSNPEAASDFVLDNWEGNPGNKVGERQQSAREWYSRIKANPDDFMLNDKEYVDSILEMARSLGMTATDNAVADAKEKCINYCSLAHGSIAEAAVNLSVGTWDEGLEDYGTGVYKHVFKEIFPGDARRLSADRFIGAAVRWSGSDDYFPAGDLERQVRYMTTSDSTNKKENGASKWEVVGTLDEVAYDKCPDVPEPEDEDDSDTDGEENEAESDQKEACDPTKHGLQEGDIVIASDYSHGMIYVGNTMIQMYHPSAAADANTASASSGKNGMAKRGPSCSNEISKLIGSGKEYTVYRCTSLSKSRTYENAGAMLQISSDTTGVGDCDDALYNIQGSELGKRIVKGAMKYLGENHQCTELASLALRSIGINIGVYWPDEYVTQIPRAAAAAGYKAKVIPYRNGVNPAAGDIIIYGHAHIAVAKGNGQAVHGNYKMPGDVCEQMVGNGCPTREASMYTGQTITHIIHITK